MENKYGLWGYEDKWRALGKKNIAGTDEAGRGPLAGPVVAAAVIFEPFTVIDGVNDSKKLSQKKRELVYDEIIDKCVCYSVAYEDSAEIDRVNILNASLSAMKKSVCSLSVFPEVVLIDGKFVFDIDIDTEAVIKGDSLSFSIAAASIIAKINRDRLMLEYDIMYPEYGFAKHKGYPTREHYAAVAKHGPCPIHRRSFRLY